MTTVRAVSLIESACFLAVFCAIVRDRSVARDRAYRALVGATGSLAVATVAARLSELADYRYAVLGDVTTVSFLAAAYGFLMFRHGFIPLSKPVRFIAFVATAGTIILDLAVRLPPQPQATYSTAQLVGIGCFMAVWIAFLGEPAFRFWRASRELPVVQRARLRAISVGYWGTIGVLAATLAAAPPQRHRLAAVFIQLAALLVVALLYMGFAPPPWLRRLWREPEEDAFRLGVENLLLYTPRVPDLAARAVQWAARLVGADAGVIVDSDGNEIARVGDPDDVMRSRAAQMSRSGSGVNGDDPSASRAIFIPLHVTSGLSVLAVRSGRFAPLFGSDELARLTQYAAGIVAAIDRVALVEQLAARTRQYEALLGALSDLGEGYLVLNGTTVAYANDAYFDISGYRMEELATMSLLDLTVPEDYQRIMDIGRRRRAGEAVPEHYETAMTRKDGKRIDVEVSVKMLSVEDELRVFSLVRDITERKKAERELTALDESRRAFIANAAHELRTPLTVVSGIAAILAEPRETLRPDHMTESFAALQRQVERIRVLVDNLLDLSQIEQGRLSVQLQTVPLRIATERAVEGAPPPSDVAFHMTVPEDMTVVADPHRLDQVLVNFLTNAYRYGGRDVAIEATRSEGIVTVTVTDDGPGVPDELVPHLFDPFTRGPAVRRVQGSGLGLAIVRRLVEAFGGDVWYEPVAPHGARFVVRLPAVAA